MEQEDKNTFISPAGAIIAAICFFLPWIKFSCAGQTKYASGADLGGIYWVVFISALAIIGAFFFFRSQRQVGKSKVITILSSIVALGVMVFKYVNFTNGMETEFGTIKPEDIGLEIQFGGIGTLLGFVVALIGSQFLKSID
ncbi:MAG: hypothetical protein IID12_08505 [Candidatus Marinimicrobia bacterium]|nr:hypothetical protein [Candidatus Neomarinimicrobiota bacterium]